MIGRRRRLPPVFHVQATDPTELGNMSRHHDQATRVSEETTICLGEVALMRAITPGCPLTKSETVPVSSKYFMPAGIVTHNARDLGRGELVLEPLRVLTLAQCSPNAGGLPLDLLLAVLLDRTCQVGLQF